MRSNKTSATSSPQASPPGNLPTDEVTNTSNPDGDEPERIAIDQIVPELTVSLGLSEIPVISNAAADHDEIESQPPGSTVANASARQCRRSRRAQKPTKRLIEAGDKGPSKKLRSTNNEPSVSLLCPSENTIAVAHIPVQVPDMPVPTDLDLINAEVVAREKAMLLLAESTPTHYVGEFNNKCISCGANYFKKEATSKNKYTECCKEGRVKLPSIPEPLPQFRNLIFGSGTEHRHVMDNVIYYNNSLAFASVGIKHSNMRRGGPFVLKLNAQIVHRTGSIVVDQGEGPVYAQLYVVDPSVAVAERKARFPKCREDILEPLGAAMLEGNNYAKSFMMLKSVMDRETERTGVPIPSVYMWLIRSDSKDPRRFNVPTSNEIAIVFRSSDGEPRYERDIAIHPIEGRTTRISELSHHCDPMAYPMLYSGGGYGWTTNIKLLIPQRKTRKERAKHLSDLHENIVMSRYCRFIRRHCEQMGVECGSTTISHEVHDTAAK